MSINLQPICLAVIIFPLLSACVTSSEAVHSPPTELQSDFSAIDWVKTFEPKQTLPWRQGAARTHIVYDQEREHKVLEINYPKGGVGPSNGGAQWISYLPAPADKLTVSYQVKFAKNFDWVLGGKLPGLIGGKDEKTRWPITGGIRPTGVNGWSSRIMWKKNGEIIQYVYHMDQPGKYGDEFQWTVNGQRAHFEAGAWQKVTTEITLNNPGKKDGRIRSWLGKDLTLDRENLEFRSTNSIHIDAFCFSTFFGGEDPEWAPTKNETIRFDDFKVVRESSQVL